MFDLIHNSMDSMVIYMRREMMAQKESILSEQLNSLVKDGVILYEETEPVFVEDNTDVLNPKIRLLQKVQLKFRGEEVLNEYREKVKILEEKLATLKRIFDEEKTK